MTTKVALKIHETLLGSDIEYVAYSSNGVNLFGDRHSINAAKDAFHDAAQIAELRRNLDHWRHECGKLHAEIERLQTRPEAEKG